MKSLNLIRQTLYAGLGLVGQGTNAVMNLSHELSRRTDISAARGEKIARKLEAQSRKVVKSIRKTLDAEVRKGADAIHQALREDVAPPTPRTAVVRRASRKARPARTRARHV